MTLPPRNYAKRNRDGRLRSPVHLAFVRKHLCVLWMRRECEGKIEAAHLRDLAPMGHGAARPSDSFTVSMCRLHHRESEKREREWQAEYGLDLMALALEFASKSPDPRIKAAAAEFREAACAQSLRP